MWKSSRRAPANAFADLIRPHKVDLGNFPTPITHLVSYSRELPTSLYIKREDLGGLTTTGGPLRKLEFLLQEAKIKKATCIITCGDIQSEAARSTAIAARQLGLDTYLYLRGEKPKQSRGNLFLSQLVGAAVYYLSDEEYKDVIKLMTQLEHRLIEQNQKPYIIHEGCSDALGCWGPIMMMKEAFADHDGRYTHVVLPVHSGGTIAGVLIAKQMMKLKHLEVIGVCIDNTRAFFQSKIAKLVEEFNKKFGTNYDSGNYVLWDQYGSDQLTEIAKLSKRVARIEGLLLDPIITGKAFYALVDQILNNSLVVGGKSKILFIHPGGLFTLLNSEDIFNLVGEDLKQEHFVKPGDHK
eukprot:TRINITY_DN7588_c0_g3_i1.p1 TRINITY_DN7588_c0_g3~~TRINITY_DN7588_c0_g3_i1.p1  ORF type:complete len:353 (-),score=56.91 TRINITY_DN7588_c0_g3_i1:114-1172(-)